MIQQYLDDYVKDQTLTRSLETWLKTKENKYINDEKSAFIGQLYGGALRLYSNTQGNEEKNIHPLDLKQFDELFMQRLEGLERKIENELNKKIEKNE
jgi:hypothetical protein